MMRWLSRPARSLILGAAAGLAYALALRPRSLRRGATDMEGQRSLPGDAVVPSPRTEATHAVTVHAPLEQVWRELVAVAEAELAKQADGSRRLAAGCDLSFGFGGMGAVAAIEPPRVLLLRLEERRGGSLRPAYRLSWLWLLTELDSGVTRLLARSRFAYGSGIAGWLLGPALVEPRLFAREQALMAAVKRRAEETLVE